jgi:hypothetical protein
MRRITVELLSVDAKSDSSFLSFITFHSQTEARIRADERTRTADLLIMSALSYFHRCFQTFHKPLT